jgi:hypothetical protein
MVAMSISELGTRLMKFIAEYLNIGQFMLRQFLSHKMIDTTLQPQKIFQYYEKEVYPSNRPQRSLVL